MNANPHCAIIGAWIAGLACARSLTDAGFRVTVLDKSRGPGERTSTRRGEGWACDHDPQGVFVRRWLPALRRVPDAWLFEPWRMPESVQARCGVRVGEDIALPRVDLETATRAAKARVHALRAQPEVRAAKAAIVERHGSRKRPEGRRARAQIDAAQAAAQLDLGF